MVSLLLALTFAMLDPNTEILVISEGCGPCVKAIRIIEDLQDEGYDVVIVQKKDCDYKIRATPTLIIRERGKRPRYICGLQTEEKYRELITCI